MSNSSELLRAAIYAINKKGDTDEGLRIARQIMEHYPQSPEADEAEDIIEEIAPPSAVEPNDHEQTEDYTTEKQETDRAGNDWNENAGSKFARTRIGIRLVLVLLVILGIWALATAACGLLALFFGFTECPRDLFALLF